MKKKKDSPGPYATLTKDTRLAGTYEVLVPVPTRVKPLRVPLQFATQKEAEAWIHSPDGIEMVAQMREELAK